MVTPFDLPSPEKDDGHPHIGAHGVARFRTDIVHPRSDPSSPWRSLGEPIRGGARLLHVVETGHAVMVHGFFEAGAAAMIHQCGGPAIVYRVGGPRLQDRTAGASRLTYHPAGHVHTAEFRTPTHVLSIELKTPRLAQARISAPPTRSLVLPATAYEDVWEIMLLLVHQHSEEETGPAVERLARRAAALAGAPPPAWLCDLKETIHAQWRSPPSAAELAAKYGCSPGHLCRSFKQWAGVTMTRYSLLIRLDHARGLLWGTTLPIAQVAWETGFSDQSHLTRLLSLRTGKTPTRFRWTAPCERRDDARLE